MRDTLQQHNRGEKIVILPKIYPICLPFSHKKHLQGCYDNLLNLFYSLKVPAANGLSL